MKLSDFLAAIFYGMPAKELESFFKKSDDKPTKEERPPEPAIDLVTTHDDRFSWG